MKALLFFGLLVCFVMPGLIVTAGKEPPLLILQSAGPSSTDTVAMAMGSYEGADRLFVFRRNSIVVYDQERSILEDIKTSGNFHPVDPVVDSGGNIILINSATDEIGVMSPTGQWLRSFRVAERPISLGVLSNGNLVIASPSDGKLMHIYSPSGRKLHSFGDIALIDTLNDAQNLFLNRGKVVVDPSDRIYFVFKYRPNVLKFSKKGKLISEFRIEGQAIDLQTELASGYLRTKPRDQVGGIVITNSATIDPATGHLWICMNGSSRAGLVLEYSRRGKKLREYTLVVKDIANRPVSLTFVTDLLVRGASLQFLVGDVVYSVSSDRGLAASDYVFPQEACPSEQVWPACSITCQQGTCPAAIDCKAILAGQIAQGLRVVGQSCQSLGPGLGTPPKPNGGCIASVTTCDTTTGIQVTHTTNQDCSPLKYQCVGSNCVLDCNGPFTTANCNKGGR